VSGPVPPGAPGGPPPWDRPAYPSPNPPGHPPPWGRPGYPPPPGAAWPGSWPPGTPYGPPGRPLPPPAVSPAGVPLADFGIRLVANLIDGLVVGVVSLVVALPVLLVAVNHFVGQAAFDVDPSGAVAPDDADRLITAALLPILGVEAAIFLFMLVVQYLYMVEFMHRSGQTLGKRIMRIRVVPLDPYATLTRGAAAVRFATQIVAGVFVPFFSLLDGLWQLWDRPFQQCLHDKAAQTVVVKVSA
jgi:uncharacterized RDD family membrane protein YckC